MRRQSRSAGEIYLQLTLETRPSFADSQYCCPLSSTQVRHWLPSGCLIQFVQLGAAAAAAAMNDSTAAAVIRKNLKSVIFIP